MNTDRYATGIHEGAHVAACLSVRRHVELVEAPTGSGSADGRFYGRTRAHVRPDRLDVVVRLVGYLAEERYAHVHPPIPWPPTAEKVAEVELEGLGAMVAEIGLDADEYEECVRFAERLVALPAFQDRVRLIASALEVCPRLSGEDVAELLGLRQRERSVAD